MSPPGHIGTPGGTDRHRRGKVKAGASEERAVENAPPGGRELRNIGIGSVANGLECPRCHREVRRRCLPHEGHLARRVDRDPCGVLVLRAAIVCRPSQAPCRTQLRHHHIGPATRGWLENAKRRGEVSRVRLTGKIRVSCGIDRDSPEVGGAFVVGTAEVGGVGDRTAGVDLADIEVTPARSRRGRGAHDVGSACRITRNTKDRLLSSPPEEATGDENRVDHQGAGAVIAPDSKPNGSVFGERVAGGHGNPLACVLLVGDRPRPDQRARLEGAVGAERRDRTRERQARTGRVSTGCDHNIVL